MRQYLFLSFIAIFPLGAQACTNDVDSDALVVQNKRLPDAIHVITGRFERNPPRYYQMRIERVERELKSAPYQFGLYDDLAVAHSRLGDDIQAMRVMAQKRIHLPAFNPHDKANKETWYRYFANDGTFRVHYFLHEGAKIQHIAELKQARAEIHRAIQIKPNAHFGREKYQLLIMDWMLARKTYKTYKTLADFLERRLSWSDDNYSHDPLSTQRQAAAEGLSGIIVLGAAWQSPDIFDALRSALASRATIALSYLARKRCEEIQKTGHVSLSGKHLDMSANNFDEAEMGLNDKNRSTLDALYPQLRQEAEQWNANRDKWMEAKFAQGQHPDTSPTFWQGFTEISSPSLDVSWFNEAQFDSLIGRLFFGGLLATAVILRIRYVRKRAAIQTSFL